MVEFLVQKVKTTMFANFCLGFIFGCSTFAVITGFGISHERGKALVAKVASWELDCHGQKSFVYECQVCKKKELK